MLVLALVLLAGFEADSPFRLQDANALRVREHATEGQYALRLTLRNAEYPGVLLEGERSWANADFARLDVFNPQSNVVNITVRMDDNQSKNFGSRYNEGFALRPGANTIELPLRRLLTSDAKRNLDPAHVRRFLLFGNHPREPVVLYLDNFRLENAARPSGGLAFDFGPVSSPVFAGFTGVSSGDRYDSTRGYGWDCTDKLEEGDNELPDSLCRDFVRGGIFVVNVPNGKHTVVICAEPIKVDILRGIGRNWWPGKDVWTEEVLPKFPEEHREMEARDGRLTLDLTGRRVFWLAVDPVNDWRAERREEFYKKYFYLEPYRPPPNPSAIKINAARGQTAHVFFNADKPPPDVRAVRLMERPIGRGIYRIEPMVIVPATNCPHASRFCATFRFDEPGTYRRELAGIEVEVRVWPFTLPEPDALDMTYGWYYGELHENELRDMVEHGFNSVTVPCPAPRRDGSLDTKREDAFLVACRRAGLVKRHRAIMPSMRLAQVIGGNYAGPEFSPQFADLFTQTLRHLKTWIDQYPILANPVDEPREQALNDWNRNFADTKRFLELYRQAGVPTAMTLMADESFGKSYLPLLDWTDVAVAHPTPESRGIMAKARELWLYNAGMNRFSWGFQPWALRATGRWEWHYQCWTQPYDPFSRVGENAWSTGWGATMPSPDGPVPTEAYENVRAGIDDYRFIFLLEQLIRAHPDKGREARVYLEGVRQKAARGEQALDEWRERIAEFIVELQAAAAK